MNCPKCSAEIKDNAVICPQCGGFPAVELQTKKVEETRKKEVLLAFGRGFHSIKFLVYAIMLSVMMIPCISVLIIVLNAERSSVQTIIGVAVLAITIPLGMAIVSAWRLFINKNNSSYKDVNNMKKYTSFRHGVCKAALIIVIIYCILLFFVICLAVAAIKDMAEDMGTTFETIADYYYATEISGSKIGGLMGAGDIELIGFLFSHSAAFAIIGSLLMFAAIITFFVLKLKMYNKCLEHWQVLSNSVKACSYQGLSTYIPVKSFYVWGTIEALVGLSVLKVNVGFSLFIMIGGAMLIMQALLFRAIDSEQQVAKGVIKGEEDELKRVQKVARDVAFQQEEEIRQKEEKEKKRIAAQREQEEYERAKKAEKAKEEQKEKEAQMQQMMQQMMQMMMLNNMQKQGDSNNNEKTKKSPENKDK